MILADPVNDTTIKLWLICPVSVFKSMRFGHCVMLTKRTSLKSIKNNLAMAMYGLWPNRGCKLLVMPHTAFLFPAIRKQST